MDNKKKDFLAIMLGKGSPKDEPMPEEDGEKEDEDGEGLHQAMSELIEAIHSGDVDKACEAFKNAMELC